MTDFGFVPNEEYLDKIKSVDRAFIEKDTWYAQCVAREYLHYIFDRYGVEHHLVIGNYKVKITEDK